MVKIEIKRSWSQLYQSRNEFRSKYRKIFSIPKVKKMKYLFQENLKPNCRVLDVGAGNRKLRKELLEIESTIDYKSFDIDPFGKHDFSNSDEVEGPFEIITMIELIEHLSFEEAIDLLNTAKGWLADSGQLIISTPNIFHPNRFFRDSTHKTFFPYDELGGILLNLEFREVLPYRLYNNSILKKILVYVISPFARLYDIDHAHTLLMIAKK